MDIVIGILDTILRYAGIAYDTAIAFLSPYGLEIVIGLLVATFFLGFIFSNR